MYIQQPDTSMGSPVSLSSVHLSTLDSEMPNIDVITATPASMSLSNLIAPVPSPAGLVSRFATESETSTSMSLSMGIIMVLTISIIFIIFVNCIYPRRILAGNPNEPRDVVTGG